MAHLFESAWLKWFQGVSDAGVLLDNIVTLAEQPDLRMESWFGPASTTTRNVTAFT